MEKSNKKVVIKDLFDILDNKKSSQYVSDKHILQIFNKIHKTRRISTINNKNGIHRQSR